MASFLMIRDNLRNGCALSFHLLKDTFLLLKSSAAVNELIKVFLGRK